MTGPGQADTLLAHGTDPNEAPDYHRLDDVSDTHYKWRPLAIAAADGDMAVARLLLDDGARPDDPGNPKCDTALTLAAQNGSVAMLRLLVAHGAKVNDAEGNSFAPDGSHAIWKAIGCNRPDAVAFLLQHGANANAYDTDRYAGKEWGGDHSFGQSVFDFANENAEYGHDTRILTLLQQAGAKDSP